MSNVKASLATILALLSIASGTSIGKECNVNAGNVVCECDGKEEFSLPDNYNYRNTTTFKLSSCSKADISYPNLIDATRMTEFVVKNIYERLDFEIMLSSRNLSRFELTNIKEIPKIISNVFIVSRVEHLVLRNVFIESIEEHFKEVTVDNLVIENVTINNVAGLNFIKKGKKLEIINCVFRRITSSLDFYFKNVTIINSTFEMTKREDFRVRSDNAFLQNNVFANASMNVSGNASIKINNTCAVGQSNLTLSALTIESTNNVWPTNILYFTKEGLLKKHTEHSNDVCVSNNCVCSKKSDRNGNQTITSTFLLQVLLNLLAYAISRPS